MKTAVGIVVFLICLYCIWFWIRVSQVPKAFNNLEQNARQVITGTELQVWATNLLSLYPTNATLTARELGTNFPAQVGSLIPKMGVVIFIHKSDRPDSPSWVRLYWGSGRLGSEGFEIGPTNFFGDDPGGHAWQPGVYFYKRS